MTQNNGSGAANAGKIARFVVIGVSILGLGGFALKTFVLDKGSAPVPGQQTTAPTNGNGGFNLPHLGGNGADLSATKNYLAGRPLRVRGSTSAAGQVKKIAAVAQTQGLSVQFMMTGSDQGLSALRNNTADVAVVSKPVNDPAFDTVEIGTDNVVLFVNLQNPVSTLTGEQVQGIMTGTIDNWSKVGGSDQPIKVFQRKDGGTKEWFEQVFGSVTPNATVLPDGTTELFQHLQQTTGGVGYGTASQTQAMVKPVPISGGDTSRKLFAVVRKGDAASLNAFVQFMKANF